MEARKIWVEDDGGDRASNPNPSPNPNPNRNLYPNLYPNPNPSPNPNQARQRAVRLRAVWRGGAAP